MNIQITSVNMRYADGTIDNVQVHFNGRDEERTISVNGYIPLTAEEYEGNEAISTLEGIVRQKVAERITQEVNAE